MGGGWGVYWYMINQQPPWEAAGMGMAQRAHGTEGVLRLTPNRRRAEIRCIGGNKRCGGEVCKKHHASRTKSGEEMHGQSSTMKGVPLTRQVVTEAAGQT